MKAKGTSNASEAVSVEGSGRALTPRVVSAPVRDGSLLSEINAHMADFAVGKLQEYQEAVNIAPVRGRGQVKAPAGSPLMAGASEQSLMAGFGYYWEPLQHDLAYFESMRDSIAILAGGYQKMTDLIMTGFDITSADAATKQWLQDTLIDDPEVDFVEVVRSAVYEILTLGNSYKRPVYEAKDGKTVLSIATPIRAMAVRKILDPKGRVYGYIQMLHRPNEYIGIQGAPAPATFYLPDEICCGRSHTHGWETYGVPPIAALPFVMKMKLQMEVDLSQMMHQHVPRRDVTYTPQQQETQDQVDAAMAEVKSSISSLKPTEDTVHTPDVAIEYKGPNGKALDFTAGLNHIEDQIFYVLPLSPDVLGANQNINSISAGQRWQTTASVAENIRRRVWIMLKPIFDTLCSANNIPRKAWPQFTWTNVDAATAYTVAQTEQNVVSSAVMKRDNGFVSQDNAAQDATQIHKSGQVTKAAKPGKLPPPTPPEPPAGDPSHSNADSDRDAKQLTDKDKGPKQDPNAPDKPDQRPKGKRHEAFADLEEAALANLGS